MEEPRYSNLTMFVFVPFIRHPAFVILSPGQFHIEKSTPKLETARYRIQLKVTYFKISNDNNIKKNKQLHFNKIYKSNRHIQDDLIYYLFFYHHPPKKPVYELIKDF